MTSSSQPAAPSRSAATSVTIQCANATCHAENPLGQKICARCESPLLYRYLWAVGAEGLPVGRRLGDRYIVVAPQVWLDTRPAHTGETLLDLPDAALPYLKLHPYRLHTPTLYSVYQEGRNPNPILLLDNVPLDGSAKLLPSLTVALKTASAVRQAHWLWQLLELWAPLSEIGVASSLLMPENLRVEGWRLRLVTLHENGTEAPAPSLKDLGAFWLTLVENLHPQIAQPMRQLCQTLLTSEDSERNLKAIALQLNQIVLEQAAQLPLRVKIASASTTGPQRTHNEDSCYPPPNATAEQAAEDQALLSHLAIVCDGIGGHAGGEVASQLAVRSLQLQIRALMTEMAEQTDLLSPEVVTNQLEAIVRVVNNVIATQNDTQGREARQRMGTTLVMALQLPQRLETPNGKQNAHELYLVHVGDSRAYWLTPRYCHLLTVDDDVASREVRMGRAIHREIIRRADSKALTQAIGTRDADWLYPTIQRFLLEEDGVLLLCSDGLSDNHAVERFWEESTRQLIKGKLSLEAAVQQWIAIANEKNGHDNASVVLMQCQVSTADEPRLFDPNAPETPVQAIDAPPSELSEASRALLYDDEVLADEDDLEVDGHANQKPRNRWAIALGSIVLLLVLGAGGLFLWQQMNPTGFQRFWQKTGQQSMQR